MLYFIFQKVEGEMSPVILTAFNNQPVDAILKEKEVWKRQVYLCRDCYKTFFLGDNVFSFANFRVKSKETPEAGKVSSVFVFSDTVQLSNRMLVDDVKC